MVSLSLSHTHTLQQKAIFNKVTLESCLLKWTRMPSICHLTLPEDTSRAIRKEKAIWSKRIREDIKGSETLLSKIIKLYIWKIWERIKEKKEKYRKVVRYKINTLESVAFIYKSIQFKDNAREYLIPQNKKQT